MQFYADFKKSLVLKKEAQYRHKMMPIFNNNKANVKADSVSQSLF